MNRAEFDRFADEYQDLHRRNIAISGEAPDYFAEYKVRDVWRAYRADGRSDAAPTILDFGAGIGTSVPFFQRQFPRAQITCLDVSTRSLAIGSSRFANARFVHFDGKTVPFADHAFDIVFAACVFHHIPHNDHVALLAELRRVLAPGGLAFVFEHNPYNPLTVRAVNSCPFDANAHLIRGTVMCKRMTAAGFARVKLRYRIFFPRTLRPLRVLEPWITWLPLGAQYYAIATHDATAT